MALPLFRLLVAGYPPRMTGLESKSDHVGFVVDKAELGMVFSEYFDFPCQSFHQLLHIHHGPSSGASTISQIVADVAQGKTWLTIRYVSKFKSRPQSYSFSDCICKICGWLFHNCFLSCSSLLKDMQDLWKQPWPSLINVFVEPINLRMTLKCQNMSRGPIKLKMCK
jgi:hypothetical protein